MKPIWNEFVERGENGYVAKKDFWAYRNRQDGSFCMDFLKCESGKSVMRFVVENEDMTDEQGQTIPMAYNPTNREIVPTVSQGVKYADEVDWEQEQRKIAENERNAYKQELKQATIQHLNDEVRVKDYDNIESACSYATSDNEVYRQEGEQASAFRDDVWAYYYEKVENVEVLPDKYEYLANMPSLGWN